MAPVSRLIGFQTNIHVFTEQLSDFRAMGFCEKIGAQIQLRARPTSVFHAPAWSFPITTMVVFLHAAGRSFNLKNDDCRRLMSSTLRRLILRSLFCTCTRRRC